MSEIEIKEVDLLRVLPGDIIVFKSPKAFTDSAFKNIKKALKEEFPDNKVLILEEDCELSAIRVLGDYSDADTGS